MRQDSFEHLRAFFGELRLDHEALVHFFFLLDAGLQALAEGEHWCR